MPIRAMWTGVVSWGMVTIPVKMGKATSNESEALHQVHKEDGGRIRYRKFCETCGKEIPADQIGKGAELATGETVALADSDLESLPVPTVKTAGIDYFCSADEIDPVAQDGSYFLWPAPGGGPAYRLLYEALEDAEKVAVCRIAIRSRESLAVIMPRNGALMLLTLYWPSEVREPDYTADSEAEPPAAQRKMAASLIEAGTQPFTPGEHHDRYSEAVRALVDGKRGLVPVTEPGYDLTAMLAAQVEAIKATRPARQPASPRRSRAKAGAK